MPQTSNLVSKIFQLNSNIDFNGISIEIFHYQYKHNPVYKSFVNELHIDINQIKNYWEIPFLPVEFFKNHQVKTGDFQPEIIFTSSGTTGQTTAKHYVKSIDLYEKSFANAFELFFGRPDEYVFLALLPNYLEREGSSLVFMVKSLIEKSGQAENGFFLYDLSSLNDLLIQLRDSRKKVILFGVTYALLDFTEKFPIDFPDLFIVETGGMKGMRKEMVREALHDILINGFGVKSIYSEYGMTELLSQAYSKGGGLFNTPPWMKVLIRDTNDPLTMLSVGKSGGINIIDFANLYSCSFIATQDLGKLHENSYFEVLGRFDNSDIRGCNLMIG